jgi:acetyl-CoA/propionyl-CoA carboxylase biotin carboxyl carrier protein
VNRSIRRLLIANRGEIALRIMRACREMGIVSIAVFGDGEESAPHVRYADEAYRLRSSAGLAYIDGAAVLGVARSAAVDAVHPGYGFLAENAGFARSVNEAGFVFIGPSPESIAQMGDKVAARKIAVGAGLDPVPGTEDPVGSIEDATIAARDIGYPLAVKAVGGGGGRGFRVARDDSELPDAFAGSSGEAERYFANPEVYLERYLEHPRHIEVQVFADQHGNVVALGERDCSIQRRHQKLVEESPSPAVDDDLRARLSRATVDLARSVDYVGAGTVEYLLDDEGRFYFLEMNTRIQVEHTVTEMVTGIDLVREQINVAMGFPLSFGESDVRPMGSAIECRINAEDAGRGFAPVPGMITAYQEPSGFGIRVDGALGTGDSVMPQYDSLIAKLIAWGRTREEAISRMRRALEDYRIDGLATTIPFHLKLLAHPEFLAGRATTTFLADHPEVLPAVGATPSIGEATDDGSAPLELQVEVNGRRFETTIRGLPVSLAASTSTSPRRGQSPRAARKRGAEAAAGGNSLVSPIQGTVIRVAVEDGCEVEEGQLICVIEAMKMENEFVAPRSGKVSGLSVSVGSTVSIGQTIASIEDAG